MFELALLVALFQELAVAGLEVGKAFKEESFGDVSEKKDEVLQLAATVCFRFLCQIASDDGLLMKETKLNRNFWKKLVYQLDNAYSSVNGHT